MILFVPDDSPTGSNRECSDLPLVLLEQAARLRIKEVLDAELGRARSRLLGLSESQLGLIEAAAASIAERLLCAPITALRDSQDRPRTGTDCLRVARALGLDRPQ